MKILKTGILRPILAMFVLLMNSQMVKAHQGGLYTLRDTVFSNNYILMHAPGRDVDVEGDGFNGLNPSMTFVVTKSDINEQAENIREMMDNIIPRVNAENLALVNIKVHTYAFTEDPFEKNASLSSDICSGLFNYFNSRLRFAAEPNSFDVQSTNEDYNGLCRMMLESGDPLYNQMANMINQYQAAGNMAQLKSALMSMDEGRLWQYLKRTYFTRLRSAKVTFNFRRYSVQPVLQENSDVQFAQQAQVAPDVKVVLPENIDTLLQAVPMQPTQEPQVIHSFQTMSGQNITVVPAEQLPTEVYQTSSAPYVMEAQENDFFSFDMDGLIVRKPLVALRTNLLYDLWIQPRFGWAPGLDLHAEYYPLRGNFTYSGGFTFHHITRWNKYKSFQTRDFEGEFRWYFLSDDGQYTGFYAGANAHFSLFCIGFSKKKGWQGIGGGAGITGGYVMPITRDNRLRAEFSIALGYFHASYDPYVYGNPNNGIDDNQFYYNYHYHGSESDFPRFNKHRNWIGPTQIGVHLTYDLLYRRVQKPGVSVYRAELRKGGGL